MADLGASQLCPIPLLICGFVDHGSENIVETFERTFRKRGGGRAVTTGLPRSRMRVIAAAAAPPPDRGTTGTGRIENAADEFLPLCGRDARGHWLNDPFEGVGLLAPRRTTRIRPFRPAGWGPTPDLGLLWLPWVPRQSTIPHVVVAAAFRAP